jgi:hypothetical protein
MLAVAAACHGQLSVPYDITTGTMPVSYAQGIPEDSYGLSSLENINLFNGKLSLNVPLFTVSSRGDASFSRTLHIQPNWRIDVTSAACLPNCPQGAQEYYEMPVQWSQFVNRSTFGPGTVVRVTEFGNWAGCIVNPGQVWPQKSLTKIFFIDTYGSTTELVDVATGGVSQDAKGSCANPSNDVNRGQVFRARDGSEVYFRASLPVTDLPTNTAMVAGSSSMQQLVDGGGYLFFPNGVRYRINNQGLVDQIRDRHGNVSTFQYESACDVSGTNCRLTKAIDSQGRETKFSYGTPTGVGDPAGATTYTLIEYEGAGSTFNREVRIYYGPLSNALFDPNYTQDQPYSTLFSGDAINWFNYVPNPDRYNPSVVMEIRYPNTRSYKFRYNAYAEPTRVELPTGGKFEYKWDKGCEINTATPPAQNWVPRNRCGVSIYRRLTERTAHDRSGVQLMRKVFDADDERASDDPIGTENLNVLENEYGGAGFTTLLRQTKHVFFGRPNDDSVLAEFQSSGWKLGRSLEQHIIESSGTTRRVNYQFWAQRNQEFSTYSTSDESASWSLAPNNPRMVRSQEYRHDATDPKWRTTEFVYDRFNNRAVTIEHNWTSTQLGFSSSTRARLQRYFYQINSGYVDLALGAGANTAHLLRLPTRYQVGSGADASWNLTGVEADTQYTYDGAGALNTSQPSVQYEDPASKPRGNVTTISRWLNTTGSWLTHNYKFDRAGNIVEYTNPRAKTSFFEYGDNPSCSEDNGASGTLAFQTKIRNAITPTAHETTRCYDHLSGTLVWEQDPNGTQTRFYHNDGLRRLTAIEYASNNASLKHATQFSYDDTNVTVTTTSGLPDAGSSASGLTRSTITFDGLGRQVQTANRVTGGFVYTRKEYDELGRVKHDYFPASSLSSTAATSYTLDVLDRPIATTVSDGASDASSYTNYYPDRTISQDPAVKWRALSFDALGRLTSVEEPGFQGAPTGHASNWTTSYLYL